MQSLDATATDDYSSATPRAPSELRFKEWVPGAMQEILRNWVAKLVAISKTGEAISKDPLLVAQVGCIYGKAGSHAQWWHVDNPQPHYIFLARYVA